MRTAKEHAALQEKNRLEVTGKRRAGRPPGQTKRVPKPKWKARGATPSEHHACVRCGAKQPPLASFRSSSGELEVETFALDAVVRYQGREAVLKPDAAQTLTAILACKGQVYWEVLASEKWPLVEGREKLRYWFYFDIGRLRTALREGVGLEGFILLNGSGLVRVAMEGTYGGSMIEEVAKLENIALAQSTVDVHDDGKNGPEDDG